MTMKKLVCEFRTAKKPEYEHTNVAVLNYRLIPKWIARSRDCPFCSWGFLESDETHVMAFELADNGINFAHEHCYLKNTTYTDKPQP